MNEQKAGVEVILTNKYSVWDGIAVAILDPVNQSEPEFRFYNGESIIRILERLQKEGLEIVKVGLLTYKYEPLSGYIEAIRKIKSLNPVIKTELISEDSDPFVGVEFPTGH